MTHFIFDVDDVLLDWQDGFVEWLHRNGFKPDCRGPDDWELSNWIGTTPEMAAKLVREFNQSRYFSKLRALPGTLLCIRALQAAGHTMSALTACGNDAVTRQERRHNLFSEFARPVIGGYEFAFDPIAFLPLGMSKFDYLYNFTRNRDPRNIVLVEDNFEHARSGAINGITSYCVRRRHNRGIEASGETTEVIWVDGIEDVVRNYIQQKVE